MPSFGERSTLHLNTLDYRLVAVCREIIEYYDFTIVCGHRGEEAQNEAYATGASRKRWPRSIHNQNPSQAIDVATYPINWKDDLAFAYLAGLFGSAARRRGFALRWGGDWDGDGSSVDQSFMDIGHLEIVGSI